jgi:hypothetical protein
VPPLAELVEHGEADDVLWRRVGEAFAAVHSVKFPALLQSLSIRWDCDPLTPLTSYTPTSTPPGFGLLNTCQRQL